MSKIQNRHNHYKFVTVLILLLFVEVFAALPSRTLAEGDTNVLAEQNASNQSNGLVYDSSEQILASYYLSASEGQDWWMGNYSAPSEQYVLAAIENPAFNASVIVWKSANLISMLDLN